MTWGGSYFQRPGTTTATTPRPTTPSSGSSVLTPTQQQQVDAAVAAANAQQGAQQAAGSASAAQMLTEWGLQELIPLVDGWIRGGMSIEQVMLQLRDPKSKAGKIFYNRFPAILERQQKGLAPISPAEYVAYERSARQLMQAAHMPKGFYDQHDDFTKFIATDVSIEELTARVNDGFVAVANAPATVRQAFATYFGANGDSALAAYFLDAKKAVPLLEKNVQAANVGGAGLDLGFHLGVDRAQKIADMGLGYAQSRAGFEGISSIKPIFDETISETKDLTAEREGVDATFGLDTGQAKQAIKTRLDERQAAFSGVGGAAVSERGLFGLGTAD